MLKKVQKKGYKIVQQNIRIQKTIDCTRIQTQISHKTELCWFYAKAHGNWDIRARQREEHSPSIDLTGSRLKPKVYMKNIIG